MRSRHCGELNRGLQNLDSPFGKGFNFVRGKLLSLCAESRFAKPRCSLQRERIVTFCVVQKVTKKHARTCKKLPVASFCASETAETGRIANGREQGDHVSRRRLRPATSIQSSVGNSFGDTSGDTSRTRLFAQNGGEKALNRCDVPALQRKELERRLKEQPCSLVDSRLWLGGNGRWRTEKSCFGG